MRNILICCGLIAASLLAIDIQAAPAQPLPHQPLSSSATLNVLDFGADPTGTKDSAPAFDAALQAASNVSRPTQVQVPSGTYLLNSQVVVGPNASLIGAGRTQTIININPGFSPEASSVFVLAGRELSNPAIRAVSLKGMQIHFAQPGDYRVTMAAAAAAGATRITVPASAASAIVVGQNVVDDTHPNALAWQTRVTAINGTTVALSQPVSSAGVSVGDTLAFGSSRSMATTLAQRCSLKPGAGICKYPPAIFAGPVNSKSDNLAYANPANRFILDEISIVQAWDGISAANNTGGIWINQLEGSAYHKLLDLEQNLDFTHVTGLHFWNFGSPGNAITRTLSDGSAYALVLGKCDGCELTDISTIYGGIHILPTASNPTITGLGLDEAANLEIEGGNVVIDGMYIAAARNSFPSGKYPIWINGGNAFINNLQLSAAVTGVYVSKGSVTINGGTIMYQFYNTPAVIAAGGHAKVSAMDLSNLNMNQNTYAPGLFRSTGNGTLDIEGMMFPDNGKPNIAASFGTDAARNVFKNNVLNGWLINGAGPRGIYQTNGVLTGFGTNMLYGAKSTGAYWASNPGYNTGFGFNTLSALTTGNGNTALGAQAGAALTDGKANTMMGADAGHSFTTGHNNTVVGYGVGSAILQTGSGNILIGTSSTIDTPSPSSNNYLNIGGTIYGTMGSKNVLTINQTLSIAGGVQLPVSTVAQLPPCNAPLAGVMRAVSDATKPAYDSTLKGGGSVEIPVFCNGKNWTAH
jgi:hypothetical protein